jgi:hypothetical protein
VNASLLHTAFVGLALLLSNAPVMAQAPAPAQPPALAPGASTSRDAPTLRTIDLAINTHYLATNFDTAEKLLKAAIEDCQNQCSPKVLAKAWSYLGVVLVTGKNNRTAATDAFIHALSLDPGLKIDGALATPEVNEIFQGLGGTDAPTTNVVTAAQPAPTATTVTAAVAGTMKCTPTVAEVETRRPIPVQCHVDQEVTLAQLRYKLGTSKTWTTAAMAKKGNYYEVEIPCKETDTVGTLDLYARAEDASGEDVGTWGSKAAPVQIHLVATSKEEPPSLRNADPPARCAEKQECPPDFPGCTDKKQGGDTDWGGGCDNSGQCKAGLLCIDGTCENAPSCTSDSDCSVGRCVSNKCSAIGTEDGLSRTLRKNWLGLHVAQDFALVSGTDVCSQSTQAGEYWACYYAGSRDAPYQNDPHSGVKVGGGLAMATTRILLSYDRVVLSNLTAGVRVGWTFGGGPPNGRFVDYAGDAPNVKSVIAKGTAFMPVHLEARVAYWFGSDVFNQRLRPYVHLGGGFAEVDVKFKVPTRDCGTQDVSASCLSSKNGGKAVELEAWKKLGNEFVTVGGGLAYGITDRIALNANLNIMYMFPSAAPVFQPSLGGLFGF